MEIDGYHACPCHSEKKIRFCCGKEIVPDLNQLLSKQKAGQELAALDDCERAIRKHGPQDCLLTMKTQLLLAHGDVAKAIEVNSQFLAKNPQHPAGYHQLALLRLEQRDVAGAVEALQDAVDSVKGNEIPVFLIKGFRIVAIGLFATNSPHAAIAHLKFAIYLADSLGDEVKRELNDLLLRMMFSQKISFVHRRFCKLPEIAEAEQQEEWAKKIQTATRAVARGQYRKSLKYLELALQSWPNQGKLLYSVAVLCEYLGYRERCRETWERLAGLPGLDEFAAIEATLMASLHSTDLALEELEVMEFTQEVGDYPAVIEKALSSKQLISVDPQELIEDDDELEGPPPRNAFMILDRELNNQDEVTVDNCPQYAGSLLCYGKQTDREAQLKWNFENRQRVRDTVESAASEFNEWTIHRTDPAVVGKEFQIFGTPEIRYHVPPQVSDVERSRLMQQLTYRNLRDWLDSPIRYLDGKTPREAAKLAEYQIRVKAIMYALQYDLLSSSADDSVFERLWLDLELPHPVFANAVNRPLNDLSVIELLSLDLDQLNDEKLVEVSILAMTYNNRQLLRRGFLRCINRPDYHGEVPRCDLFQQLALHSIDIGEALEFFSKARTEATKSGVPLGHFLLDEFEYRLRRGLTDKLSSLMEVITNSHLQEENVAPRLTSVLAQYGLINYPVSQPTERARPRQVSRASASPIIVGDESEVKETTSSKLWLPD